MSSTVVAAASSPDAPAAVLIPGAGYTIQAPLLYWCGRLLAERGWHVEGVEWTMDSAAAEDPVRFVENAVQAAFDAAQPSSRRLIVAKSFGCFALPWALQNGIPGVWLTPVLTSDSVRSALSDAPPSDLAIGGDADEMWQPDAVANSRARLVTLAGANHSLTLPGDWRGSLDMQATVFATVASHIDSLTG